jgi:hypothetical protein
MKTLSLGNLESIPSIRPFLAAAALPLSRNRILFISIPLHIIYLAIKSIKCEGHQIHIEGYFNNGYDTSDPGSEGEVVWFTAKMLPKKPQRPHICGRSSITISFLENLQFNHNVIRNSFIPLTLWSRGVFYIRRHDLRPISI